MTYRADSGECGKNRNRLRLLFKTEGSCLTKEMETCDFCGLEITSDRGSMHMRGLDKVLKISKEIDDGLGAKLADKTLPIPIQVACRNKYIKPSTIAKRKREA